MNRNEFLKLSGLGLVASRISVLENAPFSLPTLGYSYDALEPHIDKLTMEIHHSRHHKAYVDNLNKAVGTSSKSIEELLATISTQPVAVRNNGGGHWNHSFFWQLLAPATGKQPSIALLKQIQSDCTSLDNL